MTEVKECGTRVLGAGDPTVFPVLAGMVYLDHAAVSPLPAAAAGAMRRYVDAWERFGSKSWGYEAPGRVRRLGAALIGAASEDEVCVIPNTSTGLATVARGLQMQRGDTVVVPEVEFPANRFVWEELERDGVQVTVVPARDTMMVEDEDLIDAMRRTFRVGGTNVLAVSHVQFATGQRHDIARLSDAAHELGGLICLDMIQSAGQMRIDVERIGVDFACADGHKWMLGPEGAGIFYCRRARLERLRPAVVGWLNMMDAASFSADHLIFRSDARRFEAGCYNIAGCLGLAASLELLLAADIDAIERRIRELSAMLREEATRAGLEVVGGLERPLASGIVSLRLPGGARRASEVEKALEQRGVRLAARRGLLRLSPHYYNTSEQLAQAMTGVVEACR